MYQNFHLRELTHGVKILPQLKKLLNKKNAQMTYSDNIFVCYHKLIQQALLENNKRWVHATLQLKS